MSIKRLQQYLEKIEQKEPINFPKFMRLLDSLSLATPYSNRSFNATKVKGDNYDVEIIDTALLESLRILWSTDTATRVGLSTQNRSHNTSVAGSMLIGQQGVDHPQLFMFDASGHFTLSNGDIFAPSNSCLIIENEQNFISADVTVKQLSQANDAPLHPFMDKFYAEGNAISNRLYTGLFSQYTMLYLALDLDLGALKISDNLINRYGADKVRFLLPPQLEERMQRVQSIQPPEYIQSIIPFAKHATLLPAVHAIKQHRKILEQESYLNGY